MEKFVHTFAYKLIYVFKVPYETHAGLLKVGEATLKTSKSIDELPPNCKELNQAAKARIGSYTDTASIPYTLLHTEIAVVERDGECFAFKDKDVHRVLLNSGIHKVKPNGDTGFEWFKTTLDVVKNAISAVKSGKNTLLASERHGTATVMEKIDFREEQLDAITKTIKAFGKVDEMLWYAKMRFGKTLTALEVVRRLQFRRVIIVTHRPVVGNGWEEDFHKLFYAGSSKNDYTFTYKTSDSTYVYSESIDAANDSKIKKLDADGNYFIYFASIQDLRGSERVGGNFNKNNGIFNLDWDLIIIDEAHEGTQTELGDKVITALRKDKTKVLALSGTPFNLLDKYKDDNVYTWDYVMEQKCKTEWDLAHYGDHNPYADLPQMHIYTYQLGEKFKQYLTDELGSKSFNFKEFFRVWTKGTHGKRELPKGAVEGKFVHEDDVRAFLKLLVTSSEDSMYPFATEEYRGMFKHTLWMIPGVKEAKALSELLREERPDNVFKEFGIANVAGEGDDYEEKHYKDALDLVRQTINENEYSITLSCGKLTTGVTVPEWTACIMLSGSYTTAASQYMQTIFRVQSAGNIDGRQKTDCYVFDFAPDRTLRVLTDTVHLSRKVGKNDKKRREIMQEFLNYCPVIAINGSRMAKYSVNSMMEQIKHIYAERAVNSGFEDECLYNDEMLRIDSIEAAKFNALNDIIGKTKAEKKKGEVVVNHEGLDQSEIDGLDDDTPQPEELSEEEKERRERIKEARNARKKAIDILRGISIRMPLMIYGADVSVDEEIDVERFVELVDPVSWEEFMPRGVTPEIFKDFIKYYDRDVFIASAKRIRKLAAQADQETPTKRVQLIAQIFKHFRNPDKETVLTPWRVVNMHMADTLGGWCFYNEKFEEDTKEEARRLEEPRFVDNGDVTQTVFNKSAKILEINSKTGLYPLYITYTFYRQKLNGLSDDDFEPEKLTAIWKECVENNIFVICKTPMAKRITQRTLCGYSDIRINAYAFDDLIMQLKQKPQQFIDKVTNGKIWHREGQKMVFDAIVGNPPYQINTTNEGNGSDPVYHLFIDAGMSLSSKGTFIHPARFLFNAGKTPKDWNKKMLSNHHYKVIDFFADAMDVFPSVDIKGGIAISYWDNNNDFGEIGLFAKDEEMRTVLEKVINHRDFSPLSNIVYPNHLYRLTELLYHENEWAEKRLSKENRYNVTTNAFSAFPELFLEIKPNDNRSYVKFLGRENNSQRTFRWIDKRYIKLADNYEYYKVFIARANGKGEFGEKLVQPLIGDRSVAHTDTFLSIGKFENIYEAENLLKYIITKFARAMLGTLKVTQDNFSEKWLNVPMQDFSANSEIDWSKPISEIDQQLYKKYSLTDEEIAFIESKVKSME